MDKSEQKFWKKVQDKAAPPAARKKLWLFLLGVILCLQLLLQLYYGGQKEGFHEDEYYSYYSTNRTTGLYVPDREWMEREEYRKEFVVEEGEGYHYGLVAQVQSWDVHPPFFYFLLHTVSSLIPGVFSKWIGIGINMGAFAVNFVLLAWLSYMLFRGSRKMVILVSAVHGFNAIIISGVMFIRMYEWLTLFVLLCACLHIQAMKRGELKWKTFLIPLMATIYLGFLTQYYYIIFHIFIGIAFCSWLLFRKKHFAGCIKYGLSCAAALGFAILTYPASLSHIFRGYRGTGAVSEFMDAGNTTDRLNFFSGLLNDYLFDGMLPWLFLLLLLMGAAVLFWKKKRTVAEGFKYPLDMGAFGMLLFASCGYFLAVAKTALLLYETSNRYQLPIYGIVLLLVIAAIFALGYRLLALAGAGKLVKGGCFLLLAVLFLFVDAGGLLESKVLFLYEDEEARIAYARENEKTAVIVLYNEATPYHVWWCSGELLEHERVYFMSEGNEAALEDPVLETADKVIVYAADHEKQEEELKRIMEGNEKLTECRLISKKSLWSVYELSGGE